MNARKYFWLKLSAGGALASLMLGLFFVSQVNGFGTKVSHPHITREAAIFYNYFKPENQLTSEEVSWLVQGAVEEDTPPRYVNHFYDPVYNRGWTGNPTAKEWAQSPELQSQPFTPKGNQSWQQAKYLYRQGNKKEALVALGHILHLIEDVSVPEHTRNDTHLPFNGSESPYEEWVEEYLAANYQPFANQLIAGGNGVIKFSDLNEPFDKLARFANENFFSEDSIFSKEYNTKLNVSWKFGYSNSGEKVDFGWTKNFDLEYRLVSRSSEVGWRNLGTPTFYKLDEFILSDYLFILGPKATQYGASVIDLFFREVQAEEKLGLENKKPRNFIDALRDKAAEILRIPQLASKNQPSVIKSAAEMYLGGDSGSENAAPDVDVIETNPPSEEAAAEPTIEASNEINKSDKTDKTDRTDKTDKSDKTDRTDRTDRINVSNESDLPLPSPQPVPQFSSPVAPASVYGGQWSIVPPGPPSVETSAAQSSGNNQLNESNKSNLGESDSHEDSDSLNPEETNQPESPPTPLPDTTPPQAPQITAPAPAEFLTNDFTINLAGTKSEDATRIQFVIDSGDSYNLLSFDAPDKWDKKLELGEGEHKIEVSAFDEAANQSETVSILIIIDQTPPEILSFEVVKDAANNLNFSWQAKDSRASSSIFYELSHSLNGGDFENIFESATSSIFAFTPPSKKNKDKYKFKIRARDEAGNVNDWREAEYEILLPHILISEIKISGATEVNDEFVELYNPTSDAVSLSGWKLRPFTAAGNPKSYLLRPFPDNATIPPLGFYLIVHPSDYKHNITPDAVYSAKESLASNNSLILYSQDGEIMDKVGWGDQSSSSTFEGAPTADIPKGFSLERKANANSTAESMNFNGEDEILGNGFDGDNNAADFVLRTNPEPQNSQSLPEPRQSDLVKPGEVIDLSVVWHKSMPLGLTLKFTAPKNANLGEDSKYDLRYEETTIPSLCLLNIDWSQAEKVDLDFAPQAEGTTENMEISNLKAGKEYCFALKTWNGFAWSELSNTLVVTTPKEYKKEGNLLQHITYIPSEINDELTLTADKNPYYIGSYVQIKNQGLLKIMPGVVIKFGPPYWSWNYYRPTEILVWGSFEILGAKDDPVILTSIKDDRFYGDTNGDGDSSAPQSNDWGGIRNVSGTDVDGSRITISHSRIYFANNAISLGTSSSCGKKTQRISIDHTRLKDNYGGITLTGGNRWCNIEIADLNNVSVENSNGSGLILKSGARARIRNSAFRNNGSYGIYLEAAFEDQIDIENSDIYGNRQFDMRNLCGVDLKQTLMVDTSSSCPAGYPKQVSAKHNFWGSPDAPQKVSGKIDYSEWLSEEADVGL